MRHHAGSGGDNPSLKASSFGTFGLNLNASSVRGSHLRDAPATGLRVLTGKACVMTGAAGTIGRAAARIACDQGGNVFLMDVDRPSLVRQAAELPGAQVGWQVADVTDPEQTREAFAAAERRFGAIECAVLAAGTEGPVGPLEDCPDDAFDAVMALNVKGVWLPLKHCLAVMKRRGRGSIVIVSSISGVGGTPMLAPYSASKHAVLGLMRSAAREAAASGVRVNAVCPGPVDSDMMRRIDLSLEPERAGAQRSAPSLPMRRYARADEVGQMIAFLCSDASGYCTGGSYMVDGGYTAR